MHRPYGVMIRRLLSCVGLASLIASHAAAAITFVRPTISTTVPTPAFMTTADFNRDGRVDVAVSSPQNQEIALVIGTAGGVLGSGRTYEVGQQLSVIAAGNLNADDNPDIAVADQRDSGVHVLLGAGDGTFAQPTLIPVGRAAYAVAIADLDGQNGGDLVVTDRTNNRVFILVNTGQSPLAFTAAGDYAVGRGPVAVVVADFNQDEQPDLVTLNTGGAGVKDVSMLLFERIVDGLPVFQPLANFAVGAEPSFPTPGDFDGNGTLDIAMLNLPGGQSNAIDFLFGDGNGFLVLGPSLPIQCPVSTDLNCRARAFGAADFDGDGVLDLAVTQLDPRAATLSDWLSLFRGIGGRMFLPGPVLSTAKVPSLLAVADVTGDGDLDIIVGSDRARSVEVFVKVPNSSTGDRIPGQACDNDPQCLTGLCRDGVCCRTECSADERCNLPGHQGFCTPESLQRPRGARCDSGDQCESTFCVNQVCCVAGTCPTGTRCDIPDMAGVCAVPADAGQSCERVEHCRSGFCVDDVCCGDACEEGRCDSPGHEGTCTGSLIDGETCSANAQCGSGVCDASLQICCATRCTQSEQCLPDGSACEPRPDPTPTPTPSHTATASATTTRAVSCPGDCDDSHSVAVSELVRGVNIALDRAALSTCSVFDTGGDGHVSVNELVAAVGAALRGCEN